MEKEEAAAPDKTEKNEQQEAKARKAIKRDESNGKFLILAYGKLR